jgi:hypothetical protein
MKILVLLIWTIPAISFGQVIAVDFEDNDLTGWIENISSRWQISSNDPISGNYSLKHSFDSPEAGTDWIVLFHNPIDLNTAITTWEFSIRYDHNPSSSNNWAVILSMSDMPSEPNDIEDALIFGVNYQGSNDQIALWKQNGEEIESIYSTGFNWEENITPGQIVSFRVERSQAGRMLFSIDTASNGYILIGEKDNVEMSFINCFLLYYKYTSNYDQGLSFDNLKITGNLTNDILPPEVNDVKVLSPQKLEISFSEIVKNIVKNEFCIEGIGCGQTNNNIGKYFEVDLPYPLMAGNYYELKLPEFTDISGNPLLNNQQEYNFYYQKAYDVVINEIMADPNPTVLLPDVEYIELYNRTDAVIYLKAWHLSVNNKKYLFPEYLLGPKQYVVLCNSNSVSQFLIESDKILGIKGFSAIGNENCSFILSDVSDRMIHAVNFSNDWYNSTDKKEGGWSMEMINPNDPCVESGNWEESYDYSGGTPGKINSVIKLNTNQPSPELYRAAIEDSHHLALYFSEPLDSNSVINPYFFNVDQGIASPDSIIPSMPLIFKITLYFNKEFIPDIDYEISLTSDLKDCSGNTFVEQQTICFEMPKIASWADIVISEIMYNPAENEEEYIELYNNSSKTIDLKDWLLAVGDTTENLTKITAECFPMPSHTYIIISRRFPMNIPKNELSYRKVLLIMTEMQYLSNVGDSIFLYDNLNHLIDKVIYSPKDHHEIIENDKGVSLERISFDISGDDINNWQSASSDAGFKTPAAENSQHFEYDKANELTLSPNTITPNADGIDDVLEITYKLNKPGCLGRIMVFDINGNLQYSLLNGGLLGSQGSFLFDGCDSGGNKLTTGYYIIYFEAYSANFKGFKTKKTFVVANTK